jgi:predicted nucleotidyltransferase component of viral defense system
VARKAKEVEMSFESIRTKLKTVAKENDKNFMELFKQLSFERFLARVGVSNYRENLIFKGGLCLKQYIDISRETKDIDFLARELDGSLATIDSTFRNISGIDLEDYFQFHLVKTSILDLESKDYPGFRIKIDVSFGNIKDRLQIDIGIGDIVDEVNINLGLIKYKDDPLLGEGSVGLCAYPPEFIFSEKLQAIIELKSLNSRMKDYYDCYMLIKSGVLDDGKVKSAIEKTFEKRSTEIELVKVYDELITLWSVFLRKLGLDQIELEDVIKDINEYLKVVCKL